MICSEEQPPAMRIVPVLLLLSIAAPAQAHTWQGEILSLHNAERARWRSPALAWDAGLAAGAERWANELARSNRFGHSPRATRGPAGENLWMGTTGAYPVRSMVGSWLSERRWFRPSVFPAVSTTGRWSDVGHYSQMVASRTTKVGCALRSNAEWTFLVCRYGPSGNVAGQAIL